MIKWIIDHIRIVYVCEYEKDGQWYCLDISNSESYENGICEMHYWLKPRVRKDVLYVKSKYATYEPGLIRELYKK